MKVVSKPYTSEQLANAEKMFMVLSALPAEKQKTVTMVTNAFIEGMKAQEMLVTAQDRPNDERMTAK